MNFERIAPPGSILFSVTNYVGAKVDKPTSVIIDGITYSDIQLVEASMQDGLWGIYGVHTYLARESKSEEQIAAERAVEKAEEALKAAKEVLNKVKER